MPTKAFCHTDFPSSISQDIASLTNSSSRPPDSPPGLPSILLRCERDILKVCKALLEVDRKVNALSKACRRQAPPVYDRMSTALVDSGKQVIRGGIYNISATESSDDKCSLEVLSNEAKASTPPAAASVTTSFTLSAAASSTLVAAATTLPAAAMFVTPPPAGTSSTIQVTVTSFTLSVSNSHNKGLSEAKTKCGVAKIGGIKLKTKQLKRRWEQIAGHTGDRSPMLVRHKRIKRGDEIQYISPDVDVAYSSRAVTYLSEVGVSRGGSLSDWHHYNLPLARRRMLCRHA
jgi:hypothetical protein